MLLTPKDIHDKTFKRSFKGYDENEVDEFLDLIIREFNVLIEENNRLRTELNTRPASVDTTAELKNLETLIRQAIDTAQKSSDSIVGQANEKAEEVIREAEEKARRILDSANIQLLNNRYKTESFKQLLDSYKEKFESLLSEQQRLLNDEYQSLMKEMESGAAEPGAQKEAMENFRQRIDDLFKPYEKQAEPAAESPEPVFAENPEPPAKEPDLTPDPAAITPTPQKEEYSGIVIKPQAKTETENGLNPVSGAVIKPLYTGVPESGSGLPHVKPETPEQPAPPAEPEQSAPKPESRFQPNYAEYAWLYKDKTDDSDVSVEMGNYFDVAFKNPKDKEELKKLIDEVID